MIPPVRELPHLVRNRCQDGGVVPKPLPEASEGDVARGEIEARALGASFAWPVFPPTPEPPALPPTVMTSAAAWVEGRHLQPAVLIKDRHLAASGQPQARGKGDGASLRSTRVRQTCWVRLKT